MSRDPATCGSRIMEGYRSIMSDRDPQVRPAPILLAAAISTNRDGEVQRDPRLAGRGIMGHGPRSAVQRRLGGVAAGKASDVGWTRAFHSPAGAVRLRGIKATYGACLGLGCGVCFSLGIQIGVHEDVRDPRCS